MGLMLSAKQSFAFKATYLLVESLLQVIVLVRVVLKYPLTLSSLELSCSRLPLERSKAKNEGDTSLLGGLCRPTVTWLQVSATPGDTWQSIDGFLCAKVGTRNGIIA